MFIAGKPTEEASTRKMSNKGLQSEGRCPHQANEDHHKPRPLPRSLRVQDRDQHTVSYQGIPAYDAYPPSSSAIEARTAKATDHESDTKSTRILRTGHAYGTLPVTAPLNWSQLQLWTVQSPPRTGVTAPTKRRTVIFQ